MNETLGNRIEKIRLNMGMNKTDFGNLFGASGSLVNKWENHNITPSEERLKRIAKEGDYDNVDELLYGKQRDILGGTMPTPELTYYDYEIVHNTELDRQSHNIYRSYSIIKLTHELKEEIYYATIRNLLFFSKDNHSVIQIISEPILHNNNLEVEKTNTSNVSEIFSRHNFPDSIGYDPKESNHVDFARYLFERKFEVGNIIELFYDGWYKDIKKELIKYFNTNKATILYYRYPTFEPVKIHKK